MIGRRVTLFGTLRLLLSRQEHLLGKIDRAAAWRSRTYQPGELSMRVGVTFECRRYASPMSRKAIHEELGSM